MISFKARFKNCKNLFASELTSQMFLFLIQRSRDPTHLIRRNFVQFSKI